MTCIEVECGASSAALRAQTLPRLGKGPSIATAASGSHPAGSSSSAATRDGQDCDYPGIATGAAAVGGADRSSPSPPAPEDPWVRIPLVCHLGDSSSA